MAARRLNLPDSASVASTGPDGRLSAPSAVRNIAPILEVVTAFVPPSGRALEIASGTGEHIVRYAAEFPRVFWQPTDVDPTRISSIRIRVDQAGFSNLADPVLMDATAPGWADKLPPQDLIILVNLLHLISAPEANALIAEACRALAPGGALLIYGPFLRDNHFASPGDESFHKALRAQDPEIGYKSFQDIQSRQSDGGLVPEPVIEMPANNLILTARKPPATMPG